MQTRLLFRRALQSGQPGVLVRTDEAVAAEFDTILAIEPLRKDLETSYHLFRWSVLSGLTRWEAIAQPPGTGMSDWASGQWKTAEADGTRDLASVLTGLLQSKIPERQAGHAEFAKTVLLITNLHYACAGKPTTIELVAEALRQASDLGFMIVAIVPPSAKIPPEISPLFLEVTRDLPDRAELTRLLDGIVTPTGQSLAHVAGPKLTDRLAVAGAGMTGFKFTTTIARLVAEGAEAGPGAIARLRPDDVWAEKARAAEETGLLTIHRETQGLESLAGLPFLKERIVPMIRRGRAVKFCLVGPPGYGKTTVAKRLGKDTGLPVVIANLEAIGGRYVGDSEGNVRQMQQFIEANAPCVVVLDEINRFITTDGAASGVDQKTGGQWLTWLSSAKVKDIVIVATANDIAGVGTLTRPGRFDFTFYSSQDRTADQVKQVWDLYADVYELGERGGPYPAIAHVSPSEQEVICKLASSGWMDEPLEQAAKRVVRVAETQRDSIDQLEKWGKAHCVNFETGFRFDAPRAAPTPARRLAKS